MQILFATLAAVPLLAIIVTLLASADAAFEGLITHVAGSVGAAVGKLILSVIIFMIIIAYAVSCKFDRFKHNSTCTVPDTA